MTDERLKRLFALQHSAAPVDRRACPDPERLRRLAEREGPERDRLATLDHVMTCAPCRADYELLSATATLRPPARAIRWPTALAASVLLAVAGAIVWSVLPSDRERGELATMRIHAPVGAIEQTQSVSLVWAPVPDAFVYHAEVLAADGAVRFVGATSDTVLALPDSVMRPGEGELFWWVRASLRGGGEVPSDLTGFRWVVQDPRPPARR